MISNFKASQATLVRLKELEVISKILEKRYNLKMSPDAIKRSATRFAKSIKIQKRQKDVRDI